VSRSAHEFHRGEGGYEEARRATCWNARTPDRYPDVVVQALTEADLIAAVRAALPRALPHALAIHCAEEYANLAALLPELWRRFGQ
jgi:FAD/FMN-containing dehydrogenase